MKTHIILIGLMVAFLSACSGATSTDTTITLGAVYPLTGPAAVYGATLERITALAVSDINAEWEVQGKNLQLNVVYEDGKCSGKDGLVAAQKLVNVNDVSVILGGCSPEMLGIAPFTEEREVLLFSSLASTPDLSTAGDFVFRNYPSDVAQVAVGVEYIAEQGYGKVAILSENSDYSQALRKGYQGLLPGIDVEIVVDEAIDPNSRDIRTDITKVLASDADAIIVLVQTIPVGIVYYQQLFELGNTLPVITNEVAGFAETRESAGTELEGVVFTESVFTTENEPHVQELIAQTECTLGLYCVAIYDGVILLAEKLEECGEDTACIRDALYATQNWVGPMMGSVSFDANGDVAGDFAVKIVENGQTRVLN